jgi:hypothetical protein
MATTSVYRTAGLQASANARSFSGAAAGLAAFAPCPWSISKTTKPATRMFPDVHNHGSRRLWKPSP